MAWIRVDQTLPNHRKTLLAADALDIDPAQMVGHLVCFWMWAIDNAPHGDCSPYSARVVARAAQWFGDAGSFLSAIQDAGFLDDMQIHDWFEYAGKLIEQRETNAARMRETRKRDREQTDEDGCDARAPHMQGTDGEQCDERSRAYTTTVTGYEDQVPSGGDVRTREGEPDKPAEPEAAATSEPTEAEVAQVHAAFEHHIGRVNGPTSFEAVCAYLDDGFEPQALCEIFEWAGDRKKRGLIRGDPWPYTASTLGKLRANNMLTLAAWQSDQAERLRIPEGRGSGGASTNADTIAQVAARRRKEAQAQ